MADAKFYDRNWEPKACAHCPQQATGFIGPYGTLVCDDHNPGRAGRTLGEHESPRPTAPITETPDDFARALGITPEETTDA